MKNSIAKWKARRVASLISEVVDRNKAGSPVISSMEGRITTSAHKFAELYDLLLALTRERRNAIVERDRVTGEVLGDFRQWIVVAGLEVGEIRRSEFRTKVPSDVPTAISNLLAMVERHELAEGAALEFGETMKVELGGARERMREAVAAPHRIAVQMAETRTALELVGERFFAEVMALRVAIADRGGPTHPDLHRLDIRRRTAELVDEVDEDPPAPEPGKEGEQAAE